MKWIYVELILLLSEIIFGFFVDIFWVGYPGELVLLAKQKEWTDVEDADKESSTESSGVRGVVEE